MKIYVATSWRNEAQPDVVRSLRVDGHEVYDFRNPRQDDHGFHWKDVALQRLETGQCWPNDLKRALAHPRAVESFASDSGAMRWADACVLLLPCGRSAHLEAGWMAGAGKRVLILAHGREPMEPELMYGFAGTVVHVDGGVVGAFAGCGGSGGCDYGGYDSYESRLMIYVDPLFQWHADGYSGPDADQAARVGARNQHRWCHLFADETDCEELHAFAVRLGMKREWFQGDHYDLTPAKRARAVKLGAKEATREEAVAIWRGQRKQRGQQQKPVQGRLL